MATASIQGPQVDPAVVAPFVNSVKNVMSTMAGLEITTGQVRIKTIPGSEYDCSGVIGFTGDFVGTAVVSFKRDTAVKVVAAFAGCDLEPGTADFADAVGELANMIAGAAKRDLGGQANISVPSVVVGNGHTTSQPKGIPCVVIPCHSLAGDFAVEVSIKGK